MATNTSSDGVSKNYFRMGASAFAHLSCAIVAAVGLALLVRVVYNASEQGQLSSLGVVPNYDDVSHGFLVGDIAATAVHVGAVAYTPATVTNIVDDVPSAFFPSSAVGMFNDKYKELWANQLVVDGGMLVNRPVPTGRHLAPLILTIIIFIIALVFETLQFFSIFVEWKTSAPGTGAPMNSKLYDVITSVLGYNWIRKMYIISITSIFTIIACGLGSIRIEQQIMYVVVLGFMMNIASMHTLNRTNYFVNLRMFNSQARTAKNSSRIPDDGHVFASILFLWMIVFAAMFMWLAVLICGAHNFLFSLPGDVTPVYGPWQALIPGYEYNFIVAPACVLIGFGVLIYIFSLLMLLTVSKSGVVLNEKWTTDTIHNIDIAESYKWLAFYITLLVTGMQLANA